MRTLKTISALTLAGLLATASAAAAQTPSPAADQATEQAAATALKEAPTAAASLGADDAAMASSAKGDNWTAANLFEQAVTGYGSPINRFNLASSYQSTGRTAQAAALYRTVVGDGQFTKAVIIPKDDAANRQFIRVNLAEESQRRLGVMETQRLAMRSGPAVALAAGVDASALVGGPKTGVVSDARALQLDNKVEAITGH